MPKMRRLQWKRFTAITPPAALGPYSQATVPAASSASGQIGVDPAAGKILGYVGRGSAGLRRTSGAVLAAAGTGPPRVVETPASSPDMGDYAAFNAGLRTPLHKLKPARSCVAAKALPAGALCGSEVIEV